MTSNDKKASRVRINLTGKKPKDSQQPQRQSRVRINLHGKKK